ncbi:hypothetical protein BaRGS_00020672 [Batillaria attramentaria]|uniref:EF-hand domain-containing protein n=1 Tax=Batillaria attramentaria TaxID=370345 RepID=A0ABD0KLE8_9CAEN
MVEGLFTTADVNQDGHFGADDVEAIFEQCDINHDSAVSKSEFERCFSEDAPDMMMVADGFFLDLDMDKNGVLEQGDTQLYYDKIDQNGI